MIIAPIGSCPIDVLHRIHFAPLISLVDTKNNAVINVSYVIYYRVCSK